MRKHPLVSSSTLISFTILVNLATGYVNMQADSSLYNSVGLRVSWAEHQGEGISTPVNLYSTPRYLADQNTFTNFVSDDLSQTFSGPNGSGIRDSFAICATNPNLLPNDPNVFTYEFLLSPLAGS